MLVNELIPLVFAGIIEGAVAGEGEADGDTPPAPTGPDLVRSMLEILSELDELLVPVRCNNDTVVPWAATSSSFDPERLFGGENASSSMSPSLISPNAS